MSEELSSVHPQLRVERDGAVLTVTLNNPEKRNAQLPSLWPALAAIAEDIPGSGVRVVVLRGEGQDFSAGLDRRMFTPEGIDGEDNLLRLAGGSAPEDAAAHLEAIIAGYQRGFAVWRECPAIVIAAVQGNAVGAGFQLALSADLRVVADDARFIMGEVPHGLIPDLTGTSPLVRIVGYGKALELCAMARPVSAGEALGLGLANTVVAREDLEEATWQLVSALLKAPAPALTALKPVLAAAETNDLPTQYAAERAAQAQLLIGLARAATGR